MSNTRSISIIVLACMLVTAFLAQDATARERRVSGTYSGRRGGGAYEKNVTRARGEVSKNTTWQNRRGEGRRNVERNWDRETGSGSYSAQTTTAAGKTLSRQGTVTKNEDGSFTKEGTIMTPKGKEVSVDANMVKSEDGSRTLTKTYTGPEGNTVQVDK